MKSERKTQYIDGMVTTWVDLGMLKFVAATHEYNTQREKLKEVLRNVTVSFCYTRVFPKALRSTRKGSGPNGAAHPIEMII